MDMLSQAVLTTDSIPIVPQFPTVTEDAPGTSAQAVAAPPIPATAAGREFTPAEDARMISACAVLIRYWLSILPDPETSVEAQRSDGDAA